MLFLKAFQAEHHKSKDHLGQGHWSVFCLGLVKQTPMTCGACRRLRDRILAYESGNLEAAAEVPAAQAGDALVEAPAAAGQVAVPSPDRHAVARPRVSSGPGRPPAGTKAAMLCDWLEANRPGGYRHKFGFVWLCVSCNVEVNCFRAAESGRRYIIRHEKTPVHQRSAAGQDEQNRTCPGVRLGRGTSKRDDLEPACVRWVKHGMIQTKAAAQDTSRSCTATRHGECLILRHKKCSNKARTGGAACIPCQRLMDSKAMQSEVACWSLRIQMAGYLHSLVYAQEDEQLKIAEELLTSEALPYCPGQVEELLAIPTLAGRVSHMKRVLQAVNHVQRTERLNEFIETSVRNMHFQENSNAERGAFECLITHFAGGILTNTVKRDDLVLAAKIASGALSGHKVINCLLQSFVLKQEKLARGLERVNQSIDPGTLEEVYYTLGRSRETKLLLGMFGVTDKASKIDLTMSGTPQFWLAHTDPARLASNARDLLEA